METQTIIDPKSEVVTVKKTVQKAVTKAAPKANAKVATKVASVASAKKEVVAKAVAKETSKVAKAAQSAKKEVAKVAKNVDASTVTKVYNTGKKTSEILVKAGGVLLDNSIKSTKAIAGIYSKVGKKALSLGKDLYNETSKVIAENQKVMKATSIKAFKDTVDTIQDSHIIEFPFKKK